MPDNVEALAAPQGDSSGATNAQASESTSGTNDSPGGTGGALTPIQRKRLRSKQWYAKWVVTHKEQDRERKRIYYALNKSKISERTQKWRIKNKEKIRAHGKTYRSMNYGKELNRSRLYHQLNKDKAHLYYVKNKEKFSKMMRNRYSNNKSSYQQRMKQWYIMNKDSMKPKFFTYHINRKYGITKLQWDNMLIEQDGRCALCGEPFGNIRSLLPAVDHNHVTKQVRKLLHLKCNVELRYHENHGACQRAREYLDNNGGVA